MSPTTPVEVNSATFIADLAKAVGESAAKAVAESEAKTKVIEFTPKAKKSVYNPTEKVQRPKLTRTSLFCGSQQFEARMTDPEIELFNQIKPGRYNNRKWEVIERQLSDIETVVEVRIPVKEISERIELAMEAPDLTSILRKIITEQNARS